MAAETMRPVVVDLGIFSDARVADSPPAQPLVAPAQKQAQPQVKQQDERPVVKDDRDAIVEQQLVQKLQPISAENQKSTVTTPSVQPTAAANVSRPQSNATVFARDVAPPSPGPAQLSQQYSREHFGYIQRMISEKVRYPRAARSRSQEGTLVVSFVVMPDGRIGHLQLVKSSGHELLDQNALESVRKAAPFPKPPVMAELKIPITYSLS